MRMMSRYLEMFDLIFIIFCKVLWYSFLVSSCILVETFLCSMIVPPTRVGEAKGIVSFDS